MAFGGFRSFAKSVTTGAVLGSLIPGLGPVGGGALAGAVDLTYPGAPPGAPPVPGLSDAASSAAAALRLRRLRIAQSGRASTLLTGAAGLLGSANIGARTLLGA